MRIAPHGRLRTGWPKLVPVGGLRRMVAQHELAPHGRRRTEWTNLVPVGGLRRMDA